MTKYKIGDRVVPFKKTADGWGDLESSKEWKQATERKQDFLYIIHKPYAGSYPEYSLSFSKDRDSGGDYFHESDFYKYGENPPVNKVSKNISDGWKDLTKKLIEEGMEKEEMIKFIEGNHE